MTFSTTSSTPIACAMRSGWSAAIGVRNAGIAGGGTTLSGERPALLADAGVSTTLIFPTKLSALAGLSLAGQLLIWLEVLLDEIRQPKLF
jgi:hypothetical protein